MTCVRFLEVVQDDVVTQYQEVIYAFGVYVLWEVMWWRIILCSLSLANAFVSQKLVVVVLALLLCFGCLALYFTIPVAAFDAAFSTIIYT